MEKTKEYAVSVVVRCAEKYEAELNRRNLLVFCMDKHKRVRSIELSFYDYNYLHLTGLIPVSTRSANDADRIKARQFYRACLLHRLSPDDFEFAKDGTTELKLDVLPFVICKNLHANSIGDYDNLNPKLYTEKIVGGQKACIGFIVDQGLDQYVPNTLLKEDIRNCAKSMERIITVFRKANCDKIYTEITYIAKGIEWAQITFPKTYASLQNQIISVLDNKLM